MCGSFAVAAQIVRLREGVPYAYVPIFGPQGVGREAGYLGVEWGDMQGGGLAVSLHYACKVGEALLWVGGVDFLDFKGPGAEDFKDGRAVALGEFVSGGN